jgi:hypothetical protein
VFYSKITLELAGWRFAPNLWMEAALKTGPPSPCYPTQEQGSPSQYLPVVVGFRRPSSETVLAADSFHVIPFAVSSPCFACNVSEALPNLELIRAHTESWFAHPALVGCGLCSGARGGECKMV